MAAKAKSEKPKAIVITKSHRAKSYIKINWTQGVGIFDLKENDNPRESFFKAFDALPAVAVHVCGLPEDYATNLRVIAVTWETTKGGDRRVSLKCRKSLDTADKELAFDTPFVAIDKPTGSTTSHTPPLPKALADLVHEADECSKDYVKGQRAQGQLPLGGGDEDEDEAKKAKAAKAAAAEDPNQAQLPMPEENQGAPGEAGAETAKAPKAKRGRKRKAK